VRGVTVTSRKDSLVLRLKTVGDAELEMWAAGRHAAPLGEILGKAITFEAAGQKRAPGRSRSEAAPARTLEFTPSKRPRNSRHATVASR
jgi:hypothetical protein